MGSCISKPLFLPYKSKEAMVHSSFYTLIICHYQRHDALDPLTSFASPNQHNITLHYFSLDSINTVI